MEEIIYVVGGKAEQWVDRDNQILGPGDAAHIPMNMVHGTYNAGEIDLVFLAILSPAQFEGPALVDVSEEGPWVDLRTG
jgi:quercetin dioxygenase-like cupin family protein